MALACLGIGFVSWVVWRAAQPPAHLDGQPESPAVLTSQQAASRRAVAARATVASPSPTNHNGVPAVIGASDALSGPLPSPASARPVTNVLEAQIALASLGISSGPIDGVAGYQTRSALRAFQRQHGLPPTGALDSAVRRRLLLAAPPFTRYVVTPADIARLMPVSPTWLGKSMQPRLDFETVLELVAEQTRAHPALLRRLNPGIDWTNVAPGLVVTVPNVPPPEIKARLAFLRIGLQDRVLEGFDLRTNLLLHFPCSIAQRVEKRPVGILYVVTAALDPVYRFDPRIFPESAEARRLNRKLTIPAGPNNPVGVAWIGLDRPGYGIHGTPRPEDVGRTESHGCFRLANWDAALLVRLVWAGLPVYIDH